MDCSSRPASESISLFPALAVGPVLPSGQGREQVSNLRHRTPISVDPHRIDVPAIERRGVGQRLVSDLVEKLRGLAAQRIAWLRPATASASGQDPPSQFGSPGIEVAQRDGRARQRVGVVPEGGLWAGPVAMRCLAPTAW